jgi:hypothetical protein
MKLRLFILILLMSKGGFSTAQFSDKLKEGIKFYIDTKDSSRFIKVNMTNQVWIRNTDANASTTVNGVSQNNITDISIRRVRLVMSGQLSDRVSFFAQFGQNNLNYLSSRKAGSFFHDVTIDYAFIKKHLSIGTGLNGWNGPSRFSNTSVSSLLVLDPPNYQEVTNDTYDQFVRRLGVYAKGKLGKLDYRVSAGKPFAIQTASGVDPINVNSTFSTLPPSMVYQGYFMYQFLDQESNFAPSTVSTYLGKKKVFNIGAGFYNQKNAMYRLSSSDTISQDMTLFAADVYYDTPVNKEKGTAFSLYGCYSNYNYGTNFLKVSGPDNPANGSKTTIKTNFNKANYGNAFPYLGTGNVYYLQSGYKLKNDLFGEFGTLQFYADCQYANYQRLKDNMCVFDAGVNWLIKGHCSKITFNYQNRPCFNEDTNGDIKQISRKGQYVVQYQVAF